MSLLLHPLSLSEAMEFVRCHHRHHGSPVGGLFAIGVAKEGEEEPCGVVIVGRPVARLLDNGWTVEITRCCTDGTRNACSILYGAARRAAFALGYQRVVTYTLESEPGTSLRAAGYKFTKRTKGGSWNCPSRPRVDKAPLQRKFRWEVNS